jgi:ankyrin repeat protein
VKTCTVAHRLLPEHQHFLKPNTCTLLFVALHIAASQGHAECIRVLVMECGADINIEDRYGYTPLFNAITSRHIHCAELLLYEDASPNHCNTYGIR